MRRPSPSLIAVLLVLLLTGALAMRGLWAGPDGKGWNSVVRSDVKGYYGYLQALFIRHDLGHEAYVWEYVRETPTGTLNKYFCGTALMMAPWFAIGHDQALGDPRAPRDGLSEQEMKAISIGAWVYMLLGLLALRALLLGMGIRDAVVLWTILAFGMGTQLLQYSALQPGWSHVYTFCAVSVFLLLVHRVGRGASLWWAVAAAAVLGLVVLIRPVNGLVLLAVPVVLGSDTMPTLRRLFQRRWHLLLAFVAFAIVVGLQPMLWYAQIGKWLAYGYTGEGFHWDRPEALKVLFGFRRGLFLYAPVLLLSLAGSLWLLRSDRVRGWWMIGYWVANTYVISSWWIWYYGSGFGSRVFVDHYPVLAIPMAMLLNDLPRRWWIAARVFIVGCIALLLFQMWQYHVHILHHESMDREKYAHTFLRWDPSYRGRMGGNYQEAPFNPNGMEVLVEESCDFEHHCTHWSSHMVKQRADAFSGGHAVLFTDSADFGLGFNMAANELPSGRALFLEVGMQRRALRSDGSAQLMAVTDVKHVDGSQHYYEPFMVDPLPARTDVWEQVEYRIPVPALEPGDRLSFYFWNRELNAKVLIDDVYIRVSAAKPY